jgi:hypothetical protein
MLFDESLCQCQAKSAAAISPRHKGIENAMTNLGWDARSIVDYMQF